MSNVPMPRKPIRIPPRLRHWPVSQLPLTCRARTALRKRGYRRLGALHGMTWRKVSWIKGCGVHTFHNLERLVDRIEAGELERQVVPGSANPARQVIAIVDESCSQIHGRERQIFLARMGAKGKPRSLAQVGRRHGITRERVRQIGDAILLELSRHGGPPFVQLVRSVPGQQGGNGRFSPARLEHCYPTDFYLRVVSELRRVLPRRA